MKEKIKYLISKLFVYEEVDFTNPLVISNIINVIAKHYPDFSKKSISDLISNIYGISNYDLSFSKNIIGYPKNILNCNDYNELYLSLYSEIKKPLT